MPSILVTGANGHLGQRLLRVLPSDVTVVAAVRSASAARALPAREGMRIVQLDYTDATAFAGLLQGVDSVVHLVGIIKATRENSYTSAHEETCRALIDGARIAVARPVVVYPSILGARSAHANPCLASKGQAEDLLLASGLPVTILQVPMVVGAGDYASASLRRRALAPVSIGLRMDSLEQPICADDVIAAIVASLHTAHGRLHLAGPESLTRRALVQRAATILGRRTTVLSLPFGIGAGVVTLLEKLLARPPVTRAMLEVLDHDDAIDPEPARVQLGIELTSLDDTLRKALQEPAAQR